MRVFIDCYGGIHKQDLQGNHHSFDDKPAFIGPDGMMAWYDRGQLIKVIEYDGLTWYG